LNTLDLGWCFLSMYLYWTEKFHVSHNKHTNRSNPHTFSLSHPEKTISVLCDPMISHLTSITLSKFELFFVLCPSLQRIFQQDWNVW
jgi:hypothetical protein